MEALGWPSSAAFYAMIVAALAAGLAASFGRELEAQRDPNRGWWVRRLLILPILAIVAATASELFDLSPSLTAFSAAMLSLGGYDVLRLVEARWLNRLDRIADARAEAAAPPGESR